MSGPAKTCPGGKVLFDVCTFFDSFQSKFDLHAKMKASHWPQIFSVGLYRYIKIPGFRKSSFLQKMEILEAAEAELPKLINRDETKKSKILINPYTPGAPKLRTWFRDVSKIP